MIQIPKLYLEWLIRLEGQFCCFFQLQLIQSWFQDFTETARQDCKGFGNIDWLTESFTCLDSIELEVWPIAG